MTAGIKDMSHRAQDPFLMLVFLVRELNPDLSTIGLFLLKNTCKGCYFFLKVDGPLPGPWWLSEASGKPFASGKGPR
jgi:hypothetical protein